MKKLFFSAFMALAFCIGSNAQTVITNNYGSPISGADGQSINDDDDDEALGVVNLVYYGFDGFSNYGLSDYMINPNKVGFDLNLRANFEKYGNYNVDFGPNYSFKIWGQDGKRLFLTAAVGPSFRMQDVAEISVDNKGKMHEDSKTQYKFDLFANARLTFNANRFTISAGYFIWGAEFKLSEGNKADGFNIALGYAF